MKTQISYRRTARLIRVYSVCFKFRYFYKHGNNKTNKARLILEMDLSKELRYKSPLGLNGLICFRTLTVPTRFLCGISSCSCVVGFIRLFSHCVFLSFGASERLCVPQLWCLGARSGCALGLWYFLGIFPYIFIEASSKNWRWNTRECGKVWAGFFLGCVQLRMADFIYSPHSSQPTVWIDTAERTV